MPRLRLCRLTPLVLGALLIPATGARAATIKVDSYGDGTAACTLRAAVADVDARGLSPTPCARAAPGPNTILLPQGRIVLTQGQDVVISSDVSQLTIAGAGESATSVSAVGASRVFDVSNGASLAIRNLTLSAGTAGVAPAGFSGADGDGGAILNAGTLTLADLAITDSNAAVGAAGTTDVAGVGGNGGAIYNTGALFLTGDALIGNGAGIGGEGADLGADGGIDPPGGIGGNGGALANASGTATVTDSTFADDVAGAGGQGAAGSLLGQTVAGGPGGQGGDGGAIWTSGGTVSVTNSTFASNSAGVGGAAGAEADNGDGGEGGAVAAEEGSTVVLASATLVNNTAPGGGGGIAAPRPENFPYTTAGVFLLDTLLASNPGGNCAAPGLGDAGGNLSYGDATCPSTFQRGNPNVGPLQNNGGPTETIALGSGSAALRTGSGCPSSDERGVARSGRCSIGAYQPSAPVVSIVKTHVTATAAQISATVTLNGGSGTATVRYGTGSRLTGTATFSLGGGVSPATATFTVHGLIPKQTYHYEVWVSSSDGTGASGARTLRTAIGPVLSAIRVSPGHVTYSDSEPATTTLQLQLCVAHKGSTCTRYRVAAKTTHHDRTGANTASLPSLPAGQYELIATPNYRGVGGPSAVSAFTLTKH